MHTTQVYNAFATITPTIMENYYRHTIDAPHRH